MGRDLRPRPADGGDMLIAPRPPPAGGKMLSQAIQKPPMNGASMCRLMFATICALIVGCGAAPQPESIKTVAAFEIPLQSKADREEFLSVLRAAAQVEGMHVDAESDTDLGSEATVGPGQSRSTAILFGRPPAT
jgi:hypothetical protein